MLKNQHLLGVITLLSLSSTIVCLLLMVSERVNSTNIVRIGRDLQEARKEILQQTDTRLVDLDRELNKTAKELGTTRAELAGTRTSLTSARTDLAETRRALEMLTRKKWLEKAGDNEPWAKEIHDLHQRLVAVETSLKKMGSAETKPR